ncbi:hypothetical protein F4810DRAFT_711613 [Camillea tinctor]|nr:hypothetical protein F4810DRAFT_711613 [Camillea tinctor]
MGLLPWQSAVFVSLWLLMFMLPKGIILAWPYIRPRWRWAIWFLVSGLISAIIVGLYSEAGTFFFNVADLAVASCLLLAFLVRDIVFLLVLSIRVLYEAAWGICSYADCYGGAVLVIPVLVAWGWRVHHKNNARNRRRLNTIKTLMRFFGMNTRLLRIMNGLGRTKIARRRRRGGRVTIRRLGGRTFY